ncbi:MAG: ABC transporter ATP-binding protein [Acidimicrobiia bacterium]
MTDVVVSSVSVRYNGAQVVSDVSFTVPDGGWMGIIGPNGAGKTTLLRAIVGAIGFTGSISLGGADIRSQDARSMARRIAYVPQRPFYPHGMSVFDFVLLGRTPHLGLFAAERTRDIEVVWETLEALDIASFAERDVASLSGGETQRISLARVVAQQAPVVVLDEATASLDVTAQHEVLELIARIQRDQGITVVSAIHDLTAAAEFCDELTLLSRGSTAALGRPEEVLVEPILASVFDPTIRVIEVDGSRVVVSLRSKGAS